MLGLGPEGQETSGSSAPGLPSPHSRDHPPDLGVPRALRPEHQPQAARWWVTGSGAPAGLVLRPLPISLGLRGSDSMTDTHAQTCRWIRWCPVEGGVQ